MVIFLTSIRHPFNSNNYRKVEQLFEMSLRSVCAQTDPNFRVVVVCNIKPKIAFDDWRVAYHVVDFPPPAAARQAVIPYAAVMRDKGTKLISGMLFARRFNPDYLFIFDADDLVNRRIAEFVNRRPGTAGWYVDAGYVFNYSNWKIQRKHGLVRYCGTTLIPNAAELYRFSKADGCLSETSTQNEIVARVSRPFVDYVMGDHQSMVNYFASHGLRMRPLPFRAIAWVQENGENNTTVKGAKTGIKVTPQFCQEFGLPNCPVRSQTSSVVDQVREIVDCVESRLGSVRARFLSSAKLPYLRQSH